MWNQKLKDLLNRFLDSKDPSEVESFFSEQTQQLTDPDATQALTEAEIYEQLDQSISLDTLRSMHFDIPDTETSTFIFEAERYRSMGKLGEGGMATVWKMKDTQLLRTVALKQLHQKKSGSTYEQENFIVEAQITAQLQHPGIVPIHDLQIDEDGNIYFTMREIQGQTLEDVIQSVHRVSTKRWETTHAGWNLRRLIAALESICQTIAYAHVRGVIHQDLKPTNIMVGDYGEILVVDWGVARVRSLYRHNDNWVKIKASESVINHKKEAIAGTPRYMAPEQIHKRPETVDERADVFALGVILFYILTQQKPFPGTVEDILAYKKTASISIKDTFAKTPSTLSIPTELIDICERAMAFNPADRFIDAKEMQIEIQAWLNGARQEEEAREILREIDVLQEDMNTLNDACINIAPVLNTPTIDDTILSDNWWSHWVQLQGQRVQLASIRDIIYQKAQGAILYAPHLPAIYDQLIALEYADYLDALHEGNHRSISKTERRLNAYLQHLQPHKQDYWKNIRNVDLASLQSQRSHGVNIARLQEQRSVIEALNQNRWVSVVGLAGVGKTHLAWQVATQWCKEKNWDVVFCDATETIKPAGILQRLTKSLGVEYTGSDALQLTIDILNRTHPKFLRPSESSVLIIDNAESLNDASWNLLGTLIEQCSNIRLLTTTRSYFDHVREYRFNLHPMSLLDSMELFTQHCKQQLPSWSLTESNRDHVLRIVNTLDRIPLAIELAGARIAEFSLVEILTRLQERFSLLKSHNEAQPTLQMALSWSCTSLSTLEKEVLYQLSVIPTSFTLHLAESIIDIPPNNSLSDILDVLTQHSLVNREFQDGQTTYTMLKSIRDYAVTQSEPMLIRATHHRLAAYLAIQIQQADDIRIHAHLLEVAAFHGAPDSATVCCQYLLEQLKQFGPLITGLEIANQFLDRVDLTLEFQRPILLLQIDLLSASGNTQDVLATLMKIGVVKPIEENTTASAMGIPSPFRSQTKIHSVEQSTRELKNQYERHIQNHHWSEALNIAEVLFQMEEQEAQNTLLETIKTDLSIGGQLRLALGITEHLIDRLTTQPTRQLSNQIDLAVLHTRLGNREQAIEQYNAALNLANELKDDGKQARIIGNLGLLYQAEGALEQALRQYLQALQIFEQHKAIDKMSALNGNIGTIYHEKGNIEEALRHFNMAIAQAKECDNAINHGVFLGNRAMCFMDIHQWDDAQNDLEDAISICDRHIEFAAGAFRGELALIEMKRGEPDHAQTLLLKGEAQVREHKEQYGKFLCRKASILYGLHQHDACKEAIRTAEQICSDLNVHHTSALQTTLSKTQKEIPATVWLSDMEIAKRAFVANIAFRWAKYESINTRYPQALHHLTKALNIFQILGLEKEILNTQFHIAIVYGHTGRPKEAIQTANEVRHQHNINGNTIDYGIVTNFLGGCHRRLGEVDKALQYHEESLQILGEANHIVQASALEKAGLCCRIIGEYQKAAEYLEHALELALRNNQSAGTLYCNVGLCHNVMGDNEKALHYYHLGIKELRKVGDRNRESLYLGNIANIYAMQKRYSEAATLYEEGVALAVETGVQANECISRGNYGSLLVDMKNWERAAEELTKSIELGIEIYPIAANVFQGILANLRSLQGNNELALSLLSDINHTLVETDVEEYTKLLCIEATIHHRAMNTDRAAELFIEATALIDKHQFSEATDVYLKWKETKTLLNLPTK